MIAARARREIRHEGVRHPGRRDQIVEQELWGAERIAKLIGELRSNTEIDPERDLTYDHAVPRQN